jgi:hypothetical protein
MENLKSSPKLLGGKAVIFFPKLLVVHGNFSRKSESREQNKE